MFVEQPMRALRVVLLTALVAGCHFDKLFNSSGGGAASRGGASPPAATLLIFLTQPGHRGGRKLGRTHRGVGAGFSSPASTFGTSRYSSSPFRIMPNCSRAARS